MESKLKGLPLIKNHALVRSSEREVTISTIITLFLKPSSLDVQAKGSSGALSSAVSVMHLLHSFRQSHCILE
jgi:hypothetical protein